MPSTDIKLDPSAKQHKGKRNLLDKTRSLNEMEVHRQDAMYHLLVHFRVTAFSREHVREIIKRLYPHTPHRFRLNFKESILTGEYPFYTIKHSSIIDIFEGVLLLQNNLSDHNCTTETIEGICDDISLALEQASFTRHSFADDMQSLMSIYCKRKLERFNDTPPNFLFCSKTCLNNWLLFMRVLYEASSILLKHNRPEN